MNNPYLTTPNGIIDLMTLPSGTMIVLGVAKISLISYLLFKCKGFAAGVVNSIGSIRCMLLVDFTLSEQLRIFKINSN